jgi:D-alanine transaminase
MSTVYLNGEYMPEQSARVSVLDRGFIFGDGVYEVIPVFGGHVLRLYEHLMRLNNSLVEIYMDNPHSNAEWGRIVGGMLERNPGAENRAVYLQVTRGEGMRDHAISSGMRPTVFAMCNPIPDRDFSAGIHAITHEDIRWQYCHIKGISLLPNILLRERALRRDGSREAILLRDGFVTEGAASNVFAVYGGKVRTPPKSNRLLPGITRDLVVELLNSGGVDCEQASITEAELRKADEIWITSSTMGIAPVCRLDGEAVGAAVPGPVWNRADQLYQAFKRRGLSN